MADKGIEGRPTPGAPVPRANGKHLFDVEDPIGNSIHLNLDTWDHIIRGHPEMKDELESVKSALQQPMLIQRDGDVPSRTCFYYRLAGRNKNSGKYVYWNVVVDLPEGEKCGRVKTAFKIKTVREEQGEILWMDKK